MIRPCGSLPAPCEVPSSPHCATSHAAAHVSYSPSTPAGGACYYALLVLETLSSQALTQPASCTRNLSQRSSSARPRLGMPLGQDSWGRLPPPERPPNASCHPKCTNCTLLMQLQGSSKASSASRKTLGFKLTQTRTIGGRQVLAHFVCAIQTRV